MTRFLTPSDVLAIYEEICDATRVGQPGTLSLEGLESALAQPAQTFDGQDLYDTIAKKAGALLFSLCQNHAFVDGNKRVAFTATVTFLRLNGFDLSVDPYEVRDFMTAIASGGHASSKVAEWIQDRLHALDHEPADEEG